MKIRFLGHACLYIETMGVRIIVDPFISGNPQTEGIVSVSNIYVDYILITHGHQDHVLDVGNIIQNNPDARIVSNYEIASYYNRRDLETIGINHGGEVKLNFGNVKYVNAIHSSELPDGTYAGNAGGFVISNDEACIYISGDSALTMDMKLIPMTCPPLDLAILCMGNYFTMGVNDALLASQFVDCDWVMGYHIDTFPAIQIDHEAAKKLFEENGKQLILPQIGEEIELGKV